jgi:hypothetical protein
MSRFTHNFGTGYDLTITTNGLTTDTPTGGTSQGPGYPITSISGMFFGYAVTGIYPASGYNEFNANEGVVIDNTIFDGSVDGIDANGLGFTIISAGGPSAISTFIPTLAAAQPFPLRPRLTA